jgi:hypothetical protein
MYTGKRGLVILSTQNIENIDISARYRVYKIQCKFRKFGEEFSGRPSV